MSTESAVLFWSEERAVEPGAAKSARYALPEQPSKAIKNKFAVPLRDIKPKTTFVSASSSGGKTSSSLQAYKVMQAKQMKD